RRCAAHALCRADGARSAAARARRGLGAAVPRPGQRLAARGRPGPGRCRGPLPRILPTLQPASPGRPSLSARQQLSSTRTMTSKKKRLVLILVAVAVLVLAALAFLRPRGEGAAPAPAPAGGATTPEAAGARPALTVSVARPQPAELP